MQQALLLQVLQERCCRTVDCARRAPQILIKTCVVIPSACLHLHETNAAFEETAGSEGLPSAETGRRYREAILEAGGSRPAMESFKAFRGREPTLDALLRHQGMAEPLAG